MLTRLGIFLIGLTVGDAAFLVTGFASFLLVTHPVRDLAGAGYPSGRNGSSFY